MKFTEILEELKKGEKVTREEWGKPDCTIDFIVYDQDKGKCMFYHDGNYYGYIFTYEVIIAEDWKIYEEKPTRIWKPESNEKYYYITTRGDVARNTFDKSLDKYRLSFKNCFKAREEAQHMVEKIKIINKLRDLSNINFGNDSKQLKYSIGYDVYNKKVCTTMNRFTRIIPFEVYFATQKDCANAIDTIGEDNLKKYYFDIAEVEEEK